MTVLESGSVGNESSSDEELQQWEQIFMMRDENGNGHYDKKKKRSVWCRPSCIPVSLVLVLVGVVVIYPLVDQLSNARVVAQHKESRHCSHQCSLFLVESVPEGDMYPPSVNTHLHTKKVWLDLIDEAHSSIEIASFYWTLRENEVYPYNTSIQGEQVFQALKAAGTKRKINLKIAQNAPTQSNPNIDTELLLKKKAAQVRSLNFSKLLGGGVLHTKFWIIDRTHFYIGSANMDWRSLTQIKELGIVAWNCSCLAQDLGKIFDVYWQLGEPGAVVPDSWPAYLSTDINREHPLNITTGNYSFTTYITSSPPQLSPAGRSDDADSIVSVIEEAEEFVYITVMDYAPVLEFSPKTKFWPQIDNAIRKAALEHRVRVRLLISWWVHSRPSEDNFLRSLAALNGSLPHVKIEIKRFIVPATKEQKEIPFARVNHAKYMVTDKTAYIGTSNWSGDYFTDTAGTAFVYHEHQDHGTYPQNIRKDLQELFERDWNGPYAIPQK